MSAKSYKFTQILRKLKIITLSRFKKPSEQQWIEDRRNQCKVCPFNTKNMSKISFKQKAYRVMSNILTLITTGHLDEDNSECSLCHCNLYYKQTEPSEICLDNRWKK